MKPPSELARMLRGQRKFLRGRYAYLLMALLAMLVLSPVLPILPSASFLGGIIFSVVLVFATSAIAGSRSMLIVGIVLAVPALTLNWISLNFAETWFIVLTHAVIITFMTWIGLSILSSVLGGRRVTSETINGSLCVYLLMGVTGAFIYSLLESVSPGAIIPFKGEPQHEAHHHGPGYAQMLYYSFVTLTTLGYGDLTPTLPLARSIAALQAVLGQFYLTVLVARLVGLHIAHTVEGRREQPSTG